MSYTILTQSAAHGGLSKVARAYSQAKQTQGEYKFDLRDGTYLVPSLFYRQGQASATVTLWSGRDRRICRECVPLDAR